VAFLTTIRAVVFLVCLPAENHWKEFDDTSIGLSNIERVAEANVNSDALRTAPLQKVNPRRESKTWLAA
jgi:hypothetical protein